MKNVHQVIVRPLITEKSHRLTDEAHKYCFEVAPTSSKVEIAQAVAKLYKVKVTAVNTQVVRGHFKRVGRRIGKLKNWKRAVVTVAKGEQIDLFGEGAPQ